MSIHRMGAERFRTTTPRAEQADHCTREIPYEQSTSERARAEHSLPLVRCAAVVDLVLSRRWAAGDASATNRALAERHLRCDEKTIRQWRDGRKAIPLHALLSLPTSVSREILAALTAEIPRSPDDVARDAVVALRDALADSDRMSPDARAELTAAARRLTGEP